MTVGNYMDLQEIVKAQVLNYLPAKALQRSKAVCRDWQRHIDKSFFIHNQSVSFSSISGFFIQRAGHPPSFISLDQKAYGVPDQQLKFLPEPVDLKASAHGLLCCQGRTGDKPYYVCNPVTRQWKKLPKPTADHGKDPAIALVYEPSLLSFKADYKVVCIFPSADIGEAYEFEIYSSVQDSWKVSPEMFFSSNKVVFGRGISFNGVAYWLMSNAKIMIFDLKRAKAIPCGRVSSLGMINGKPCRSSSRGLAVQVDELGTIYAHTVPNVHRAGARKVKLQFQLKFGETNLNGGDLRILLTWDNVIVFLSCGKVCFHDIITHTTTFCTHAILGPRDEVFPYVNSLVSLT